MFAEGTKVALSHLRQDVFAVCFCDVIVSVLTSSCSVQVHWVQQQHEKRRRKRDYSDSSFPAFGDYPSFFGTGTGMQDEQQQQHQPQYRGIGPHNVFPDPLFKEQWYLVSTVVTLVVFCGVKPACCLRVTCGKAVCSPLIRNTRTSCPMFLEECGTYLLTKDPAPWSYFVYCLFMYLVGFLLCGCETWSLTLREDHRFRVLVNRVLGKVTGEWRRLRNQEICAVYCSPDIIQGIKSRRMKWAGLVEV